MRETSRGLFEIVQAKLSWSLSLGAAGNQKTKKLTTLTNVVLQEIYNFERSWESCENPLYWYAVGTFSSLERGRKLSTTPNIVNLTSIRSKTPMDCMRLNQGASTGSLFFFVLLRYCTRSSSCLGLISEDVEAVFWFGNGKRCVVSCILLWSRSVTASFY
jgi:hypothetical protein